MHVAQELLTNDAIMKNLDSEEQEMINSIFAQLIHFLMDREQRSNQRSIPHSVIVRAAALEKQMLQVHKDKLCEPNTTSMNARIALMGAKKDAIAARATLEDMIRAEDSGISRIAPNTVSYNSVIHACATAGEDVMARTTLHRMMTRYKEKRSTAHPTIYSFNAVLNAYANSTRCGAAHDAEKMLDWIEEIPHTYGLQIHADAYTYTTVIDCCSKSDRPERAMAALDRMLQRQLEGYDVAPTVVTFTAVLHAISNSIDKDAPQKATALLSLMEGLHTTGADLAPTTEVYNSLMTVWKRTSRDDKVSDAVLDILQQMKSKPAYAQPNCRTYTIVISALTNRRGEHTKVACDLLDEMIASDDPNMIPHILTYNTFLNTVANDMSEATERRVREIFSMLKNNAKLGNSSVRANAQTYNVMMKRAGNSGRPDRGLLAEGLLLELEEAAFSDGDVQMIPTEISYSTCIGIWAKTSGEDRITRARAILDRMKRSHANGNAYAKPNAVAYSSVLMGYRRLVTDGVSVIKQGEILHGILQLIEEMRESKFVKPTEDNYVYSLGTLRLLPRQDERLVAVMKRVFDWYHEDYKRGTKMIQFVKKRDRGLLDRLKGN